MIEEWYEKQTGRSAQRAGKRLERIRAYLESNALHLEDCVLECHPDLEWPHRKGRTPRERLGAWVGTTRGHADGNYAHEVWWVVPKEKP